MKKRREPAYQLFESEMLLAPKPTQGILPTQKQSATLRRRWKNDRRVEKNTVGCSFEEKKDNNRCSECLIAIGRVRTDGDWKNSFSRHNRKDNTMNTQTGPPLQSLFLDLVRHLFSEQEIDFLAT